MTLSRVQAWILDRRLNYERADYCTCCHDGLQSWKTTTNLEGDITEDEHLSENHVADDVAPYHSGAVVGSADIVGDGYGGVVNPSEIGEDVIPATDDDGDEESEHECQWNELHRLVE